MPHDPPAPPICPHCGSVAPYGDARLVWLNAHIDSYTHRLWWWLKKHPYPWLQQTFADLATGIRDGSHILTGLLLLSLPVIVLVVIIMELHK